MSEIKLYLRKNLAEHILRDFEDWVKGNVVFVGAPQVHETIERYLADVYGDKK
jgi:hypothetical protein